MSSTCKPWKSNCTSPVPDGFCCMTIKNQTTHILNVTQFIAPPTQPWCFDVPANSDLAIQVNAPSYWTITDSVTKVVYYKSIGPAATDKTYLVLIDGLQPGNLISPDAKAVPDSKFLILGLAFVVMSVVGAYVIKKQLKTSPDFNECMKLMDNNAALCNQLHPQPKPHLTFVKISLFCAFLVLLAWLILKGPLGKLMANEPRYTINCQNCNNRGGGWEFREPSLQDGVSGWRLKLRQLRCRFGQKEGPCMCANSQSRATCLKVAEDPRAPQKPHKLAWQADVANMDFDKYNPPKKSPDDPPIIPWDICACCTARDPGPGVRCYDVTVTDPLTYPCRNI